MRNASVVIARSRQPDFKCALQANGFDLATGSKRESAAYLSVPSARSDRETHEILGNAYDELVALELAARPGQAPRASVSSSRCRQREFPASRGTSGQEQFGKAQLEWSKSWLRSADAPLVAKKSPEGSFAASGLKEDFANREIHHETSSSSQRSDERRRKEFTFISQYRLLTCAADE